jgi:hypothetical protein
MKETTRRRITVTSSSNEISTDHAGGEKGGNEGEGVTLSTPPPFYSKLHIIMIKDDVNGFPSIPDIFFMKK